MFRLTRSGRFLPHGKYPTGSLLLMNAGSEKISEKNPEDMLSLEPEGLPGFAKIIKSSFCWNDIIAEKIYNYAADELQVNIYKTY